MNLAPHPALALSLLACTLPLDRAPAQDLALDALAYRCIGPTRGGRVTAVCGVAQRPGHFFMGATGGGVWKTENFGSSWENVSDGFFATPSIGAIRVAPSAPDVVWVGTGSDGLRSNVIPGRGIYRSGDAGATWEFMGLENVGQIGAVEIHPRDPDVVFVAAIGDAFAANEERGVYRTTDGGATWKRVFRVSPTCGAVDVELHPADPDVVYASMWEAERKPWTIVSGGEQGGVWRSTDGGDTWHQLGGGLATGVVGKSDLAVSSAEPDRLWVLMEAAEKPGLYRSDDRGESFAFVSNERGLLDRPFYYCNVDCDPSDADHLLVNATSCRESTDGGQTWKRRSTPHGDNHEVWIHPDDPRVMIQCNDGGANVTRDGGATWSTQTNQPTAELYQVAVDDRYPYWVYAGQQDSSTIRVPSDRPAPRAGGPTAYWEAVGGCETGPAVPKPGDPDVVYAACKGRFGVYNHRTGQEQQYYVGASNMYGHNPRDLQYRFQRVAPIEVSPFDPDTVYHASQFVHRTRNGGVTWETISPDLTAFEPDKQVISGSPITRDVTGEEFYSTLYEIAESPLQRGVLWVGANDGPIHVTRDGGSTWNDVTPDMPSGGRVQTIEPSSHEVGTAYACVLRYQLGDPAPHVYKTEDFGASWRPLTEGLPANCPTRVLREDPQDANVLYLGTEWGMFVSVDAGASWRSFQQNLPVTPVTDIVLHRDDLVLSTMGRSFWVLDDISAVRSLRSVERDDTVALLAPRAAVRSRSARSWRTGATVPKWSGGGAVLHYVVPAAGVEDLRLEIRVAAAPDSDPLRTIRAAQPEPDAEAGKAREEQEMRAPFRRPRGPRGLPADPGLHRFVWDLRRERRSDRAGRAPLVAPGTYELRLAHAGGESRQRLRVEIDPRVAAEGVTAADLAAQAELIQKVQAVQERARTLVQELEEWEEQAEADEDKQRVTAIKARLVDAEGPYPEPMLNAQLRYLASMLDRADQRPGRDAYDRLEQLDAAVAACAAELEALR